MKSQAFISIVAGLAVLLVANVLASPASSDQWERLRSDGLEALKERNYFEALNKLKGALLVAMQSGPTSRETVSREELLRVYRCQGKSKEAIRLTKMPRAKLMAKLNKEYDPNVWFNRRGHVFNNVMPKGRIIGTARMLSDGTIRMDLTSWKGRSELFGVLLYKPDHPQYQEILTHLGGLKPGESKAVKPFPPAKSK